ncbi:hypothetical protein [Marinobacter vinifirmus]|uniref:hypothetical protein n=1 Tax=Marinobacter vinifirmus TaxID=355591 RepID=UPI00235640D5|nr:hypothetical protein [Marinobacter vinifirmus]
MAPLQNPLQQLPCSGVVFLWSGVGTWLRQGLVQVGGQQLAQGLADQLEAEI